MKKQSLIRILLIVIIFTAAAFVVASNRNAAALAEQETCTQQDQNECVEAKNSEFLLETLTRNLLNR